MVVPRVKVFKLLPSEVKNIWRITARKVAVGVTGQKLSHDVGHQQVAGIGKSTFHFIEHNTLEL